jgi:hypothetical protein
MTNLSEYNNVQHEFKYFHLVMAAYLQHPPNSACCMCWLSSKSPLLTFTAAFEMDQLKSHTGTLTKIVITDSKTGR